MKRIFLGFMLAMLPVNLSLAATHTWDVTFSATPFFSAFGQPVPADPVTGEFQITLDDAAISLDQTAGITLVSLNGIVLDSALSFTYSAAGVVGESDPGEFVVGGAFDGAAHVQFSPSTNDFWLFIPDFLTSPTLQQMGYSQTAVDDDNLFFTEGNDGVVDVSLVTSTPGVPEPSTWGLLGLGFGGVALVGMRRRKSPVFAF